ncbi:MAG: nucleotide sugar dehydrogenase [Patescibacteria group bacterium]
MGKNNQSTLTLTKSYQVGERQYSYDNLTYHKIAIVGLGYVGLPLAIAVAEKGFDVIGYDIDRAKVQQLQKREGSFLSAEEQAVFASTDFKISSRFDDVRGADIFFICVPTPVNEDHTPDLSPLVGAIRTIAPALRHGSLVVVESSINPGVSDDILIPILEFESDLMVERDFFLVYCPERVNPGDNYYHTKNIPRVIGGAGPQSLKRGLQVYESILDADMTAMSSLKEAEAVKMVENSFRDVNIAFVNELAMAFDRQGIDVKNVIEAAATKPFGFMPHYPGCGVGGHCIPVDPYYLIHDGLKHGFTHHMLIAARETNNYMPRYAVKLLHEALYFKERTLRDTPIALLGLSYKKGVGDVRESPALTIYDLLQADSASVRTYDPYVPELSTDNSLEDAIKGAKAVIVATDHDEFSSLTPFYLEEQGVEVVIDGRNFLDKQAFLDSEVSYRGIGR